MREPIAVYTLCNVGGLAIYECNDEYVVYEDPLGKSHRVKIYVSCARPYFNYGKRRIHLDECFRY